MYLEQLKEVNPLTICITNNVVKNFTANGLSFRSFSGYERVHRGLRRLVKSCRCIIN